MSFSTIISQQALPTRKRHRTLSLVPLSIFSYLVTSLMFSCIFQYRYQPTDSTNQETVCRTLSLVLSELSQLITGFTYSYENEMHHWCNKNPPALTQLGPTFKRVHRLLQQLLEVGCLSFIYYDLTLIDVFVKTFWKSFIGGKLLNFLCTSVTVIFFLFLKMNIKKESIQLSPFLVCEMRRVTFKFEH